MARERCVLSLSRGADHRCELHGIFPQCRVGKAGCSGRTIVVLTHRRLRIALRVVLQILSLRMFGSVQIRIEQWRKKEQLSSAVPKAKCRMNAKIKNALFRLLRSESVSDERVQASFESGPSAVEEIGPSPMEVQLLAEFVLPNCGHAVAQSPYWNGVFSEPVSSVLRRLEEQGFLVEVNDPRARMCCGRDESDLRVLCLDYGLDPTGSADQLADRLLGIDPTGWLMGYAGELRQCSELAVLAMASWKDRVKFPIELGASDNEEMWEILKRHALQAARDGNLMRCRTVHLAMANHLLRRHKHKKALQALYIVCVFDLCGARNRQDASGDTSRSYSRFDGSSASLAPGIVRRVRDVAREMVLSMDEMREIFLNISARLPVPKDSRRLWAVLQLALEGGLDSDDAVSFRRVIHSLLR
jgi:hypothetical protein